MASCSHRKLFDYHFGFIVGALQACSSALSLKLSGRPSFPAPEHPFPVSTVARLISGP